MSFKINNFVLALLAVISLTWSALAIATEAKDSADAFIKEWDYFDGVTTYKLNIKKSSAPGQDYHIDYNFPGGRAATDMCRKTSSIAFSCMSGETVTRDDAAYLVKLTSYGDTYTFYDPQHMPSNNELLGNWRYQFSVPNITSTYTITILRGSSDTDYNVFTSFSDNAGNHCSYGEPWRYHVTKNPDGSLTFSSGNSPFIYAFKYDPTNHQIVNPDPSEKEFKAGGCAEFYEEYGVKVIFTKEQNK